MHTVDLLAEALQVAERMGYGIRHEWLGAGGGGSCEFGGRKWLFVDLALNALEQLEQVTAALRSDPALYRVELSGSLQRLFDIRRAA